MRYILVRHVETYGNVEHRFNGHTESDYTEYGLKMKAMLEDELVALNERLPFDKIYVSPIQRAYKIGKNVADRLGMPCVVDDDLKEFNFGIFDGLTIDEAMAKDPETWQRWMDDYNFVQIPGGERYEDYHHKLKRFLESHAEEHADQTVLIVAHGGTVHSLLVNLLDLSLESKWHFKIELGSITIIDCPEGYGMLEKLYTPDYSQIEA